MCWKAPPFSIKKQDLMWKWQIYSSYTHSPVPWRLYSRSNVLKSEVIQHAIVTALWTCLLTLLLQSSKWPYVTVSPWYIWGLKFAQHLAHLLCLLKPIISKITPNGTKEAELIIKKYISPFGIILMSTFYAKSDLFQEIIWMWIALWFAIFKFGEHVVFAYLKRNNLALYSVL